MNIQVFFKKVITILQTKNVRFALAGGFASSLYRKEERTTKDLDFLILAQSDTLEIASTIIHECDLIPHYIRKASLEGGPMFAIKRNNTPPYIVAGRSSHEENTIGLDFILPVMPWFESALVRAELNSIDFGFGKIPCITVEDVILSKFYSLKNNSQRFNDLDDLKSIFERDQNIDIAYICGQMQKLKVTVPEAIKNFIPKPILLASKKIRKDLRAR